VAELVTLHHVTRVVGQLECPQLGVERGRIGRSIEVAVLRNGRIGTAALT